MEVQLATAGTVWAPAGGKEVTTQNARCKDCKQMIDCNLIYTYKSDKQGAAMYKETARAARARLSIRYTIIFSRCRRRAARRTLRTILP